MAIVSSELVMPFAGFLAWNGSLSLPGVVAAGTLGSSFGSCAMYYLTRYVSHEELYIYADKHGKWLGVTSKTIKRTERWFDRHAKASVTLGRFLPGIRTAVSLIAGYRHMPLLPFVACTIVGTFLSVVLLTGLGYFISHQFNTVQTTTIYISNVILFIIGCLLAAYAVYRHKKYGRKA